MPDKRDSKHPGLFLKRSLSIEDIGEIKALVFSIYLASPVFYGGNQTILNLPASRRELIGVRVEQYDGELEGALLEKRDEN